MTSSVYPPAQASTDLRSLHASSDSTSQRESLTYIKINMRVFAKEIRGDKTQGIYVNTLLVLLYLIYSMEQSPS